MFKRKPKVLTPQEMEEIRTKDFFDCILPGTVKFLSDHYILGDNYCCVGVIREYPPSTDEQAILSQLADRSGVTLRIYHRLVEAMEQRKIIQNATRRNRLKSGGNDVNETIEAEGNLQDVIELLGEQGEYPVDGFGRALILGYYDHSAEIDALIRDHLKGWTLERIPRVSLAVLRLALSEILYGEEKLPGVAINEAVELTKKYGGEGDHQFVNGLLGSVVRELGLPAEPEAPAGGE